MTFPVSSTSTQIAPRSRFPVPEFEPLMDAIEAAALLRMHPETLKRLRSGKPPVETNCRRDSERWNRNGENLRGRMDAL